MRRLAAAVALAFGVAAPLRAAVDVTVTGDRVHVRAARAPLGDVLDGLARRTRMKVVYDGARPHTLVSVELRDRTPAQAVLGVLEGLGVSYALVMNANGTEVEMLMIVGAGASPGGGVGPAAAVAAKPSSRHVPDEQPDVPEPEVYEERRPVPEEKEAAPEAPRPTPPPFGPLNPAGSVSPFAPGFPAVPAQPAASPTPAPQATPSPNSSS